MKFWMSYVKSIFVWVPVLKMSPTNHFAMYGLSLRWNLNNLCDAYLTHLLILVWTERFRINVSDTDERVFLQISHEDTDFRFN